MKRVRWSLILIAVAMTAACAHPMIIKPDIAALSVAADTSRIPKNVGLYISPENRNLAITTAGGGGDKVTYHPYADMEAGFYKVLGNVFQDVNLLNSLSDVNAIAKHSLVYVAVPEIVPSSSSNGVFTWMATDFTVILTCKITDVAGRTVTTLTSTGTGHADFSELKSNFSLAGERASQAALVKLQTALLQSAELRE